MKSFWTAVCNLRFERFIEAVNAIQKTAFFEEHIDFVKPLHEIPALISVPGVLDSCLWSDMQRLSVASGRGLGPRVVPDMTDYLTAAAAGQEKRRISQFLQWPHSQG